MELADTKSRGIYILANDRVIDDTLALLESLKRHSPNYPIRLIPYDDNYKTLMQTVRSRYAIELFVDQDKFEQFERYSWAILNKRAPMLRKYACWFGPFDAFIYIDTDIVVFQDQKDVFELLETYDIVYCGSGRKLGIKNVFTEKVFERNLFSKQDIDDLFNAGFFASKKGVLTYNQLIALFEEAIKVSDIFYPKLQDQPLFNYVVLKSISKRANLRELTPTTISDAWAGVKGLAVKNDKIFKRDGTPLRHIHWAGQKPIANRSYVSVWLKYRYPGKANSLRRTIIGAKFMIHKKLFWIKTIINRVSERIRLAGKPLLKVRD